MSLVISSGAGELEQTFAENLTDALLEEKVRALDWNDSERCPKVRVQRGGQRNSLWVEGSLNPAYEEDALAAGWNGSSSAGSDGRTNVSRPLRSVDEAIAILISYLNDDDQWKTMVAWEYPWESL